MPRLTSTDPRNPNWRAEAAEARRQRLAYPVLGTRRHTPHWEYRALRAPRDTVPKHGYTLPHQGRPGVLRCQAAVS